MIEFLCFMSAPVKSEIKEIIKMSIIGVLNCFSVLYWGTLKKAPLVSKP